MHLSVEAFTYQTQLLSIESAWELKGEPDRTILDDNITLMVWQIKKKTVMQGLEWKRLPSTRARDTLDFLKLEYNCLMVLCLFLLYQEVSQP